MTWGLRKLNMLVVLSLVLVTGFAVAVEDQVIKGKADDVVKGRVKKADITGVDIEVKDARTNQVATISLKPNDITEIKWDVNDADYRSGLAAFDGGAFQQAAQRFTSLTDAETLNGFRAEARAAVFYYAAESLYRSGKASEAVPMFEKLMNDYKTSWYVPLAVGSLVDAAVQTKELGKVPALLQQLRSLGGEQKPLADYYEGQMLLAQNKIKDADVRFTSAVTGSSAASTRGMALMGQAKCAIAEKNLVKARDLAKKALDAGPPANVAGAAHLVIADATVAEIDEKKVTGDALQTKLMDALLSYMRVMEMYRGLIENEAQAMMGAGECLQRLSKLPNRGADRHRAIYMYTKLTTDGRYRNTRYAALAADAIRNFR